MKQWLKTTLTWGKYSLWGALVYGAFSVETILGVSMIVTLFFGFMGGGE